MRARADVHAVVHTHAPWAVAFASTGQPLRPISHEATLFVPPDVARFTKTGDLITTPELGARRRRDRRRPQRGAHAVTTGSSRAARDVVDRA